MTEHQRAMNSHRCSTRCVWRSRRRVKPELRGRGPWFIRREHRTENRAPPPRLDELSSPDRDWWLGRTCRSGHPARRRQRREADPTPASRPPGGSPMPRSVPRCRPHVLSDAQVVGPEPRPIRASARRTANCTRNSRPPCPPVVWRYVAELTTFGERASTACQRGGVSPGRRAGCPRVW
jgi:hypothetical protein